MPLLRFRREAENRLGEKKEKDERRSDAFFKLKNKTKRGISSVAVGGGIWAFLPSPPSAPDTHSPLIRTTKFRCRL